ncbi:MAG TPA: class I SAM-dependent methyltransferase, partial [Acidimicrobiia bacterium]|nr:class I SAM-dependent methyltransferase [Acidimicrobiia bacterium]
MKDHIRHNRKTWDAASAEYQAAHDAALTQKPLAWGAYRIPESELRVLGEVVAKDVLELGCGGAQWSTALADAGSRCVGLDLSGAQLHHARDRSASLPLVQANAEQIPFSDGSFDVVFCDHGALSFCNPELVVPEVARVVRSAGVLAFCTSTPLLYLTWDAEKEKQSRRLQRGYDELGRMELDADTVDWVLPPGEWIRVLRTNGFDIE